jgi:cation transporter-like permease
MGKNNFESNYSYLSSYAHTGHLSIFQLPQIRSEEIQSEFVNSLLLRGVFIMAHFVCAYTSIYPKAQLILDEYPEATMVVKMWNFTKDELK